MKQIFLENLPKRGISNKINCGSIFENSVSCDQIPADFYRKFSLKKK